MVACYISINYTFLIKIKGYVYVLVGINIMKMAFKTIKFILKV